MPSVIHRSTPSFCEGIDVSSDFSACKPAYSFQVLQFVGPLELRVLVRYRCRRFVRCPADLLVRAVVRFLTGHGAVADGTTHCSALAAKTDSLAHWARRDDRRRCREDVLAGVSPRPVHS